jgi:cell division protein FtsB
MRELYHPFTRQAAFVERRLSGRFSGGTIAMCESLTHQPLKGEPFMRTLLLSLAGAVSALAVATPASAQWAQPAPYGYGAPGYGYGYNNYGVANLSARVAGLRQQVFALQRERLIGREEAKRLSRDLRRIDERARRETFAPTGPYEVQQLQQRLARVEQRIQYAASRGRYGYGAYGNAYGYNGYSPYGGYAGQNGYYPRGDYDRDDDDDYDD